MPRISRFSPNWSDPDALEAITVAREDLIAGAVDAVRESSLTKSKHHLLFVGPRGSGKTHLVTLVHHRVAHMDDVMENLRVAWLNEDETSDTLLSLLLRVHRALAKEYPREFPADSVESVYDLTDRSQATAALTDLLLRQLGEYTLLLLVENLDALFSEFSEGEQKRWRALIQNHPRFCTVATAQRLFQGVSDRDAPFFGFFEVHHLKAFTVTEAAELLAKIAVEKKDRPLAAFIATPRGRARIRALHHLTGGNQRLFVILSEFIDRDSLESLVTPFEELVDEQLTPYYQERLRWLPTLQRKIVEFLCTVAKPQPVKAIARHLFASSQTVSSQLMELRRMRYLESRKRGRESLYELAEPLMRLSHEVKEAKGRSPLRILVDFLRVWYDPAELESRMKLAPKEAAVTRLYFNEARARAEAQGNLRLQMFLEEADELDLARCDDEQLALLRDLKDESEDLEHAMRYGLALAYCSRFEESCQVFSELVELDAAPTDVVAKALYLRGLTHDESGNVDAAIIDYNALAELDGAPTEEVAEALCLRGLTHEARGDVDAAIADLTAVVELAGAPQQLISGAHFAAAGVEMRRGGWQEAERHLQAGFAEMESNNPADYGRIPYYLLAVLDAGQSRDAWTPRLDTLLRIYSENGAISRIGTGVVDTIGALRDSNLSAAGLADWHGLWAERAETYPELELPARLLHTAIDYFLAHEDEAVLLNLPSEERRILAQALGLETEEHETERETPLA